MSQQSSERSRDPLRSSWLVLVLLVMIAIPAAITLSTVQFPGTLEISNPNPTPFGYTLSLSLFIIPIIVIGGWLVPSERLAFPRRAFWWTIGLLVPVSFGLDFFFGNTFFVFPNPGATLGIGAPALGGSVPVEEYVFYLTGFITVLLIYIWLDEFWLAAYNVPDYAAEAEKIPRLVVFHPASLIAGLVLVAAAVIYKKVFAADPAGFPSYFCFLVATGLVPATGFLRTARPFVNWRAFSFALFLIVLISLLWEATVAVPYGWWGYQPQQMMGLFIGAWSELPIEAVCVWMAVTYATTIIFEIIKLWLASGKTAKSAFLGWE
jgi:hypothetical protein